MPKMDLTGKIALITGGGRGIGRAIAQELAELGANIAMTYKSDLAAAEKAASELQEMGRSTWIFQGDMRKPDDLKRLGQEVAETLPHLDILILNAAFGTIDDVHNVGRASWKATYDTNIVGSWFLAKELFPLLRDRNASIVTLSSIGSIMPFPQYVALGTSKSATEALTRYMATEWGRYGIRVNSVSSGPIETRAIDWFRYPNAVRRFAVDKSVFKRMGEVDDIAPVAAFLCTEAARWITGHILIADGGITCGIDHDEFDGKDVGAEDQA